MAGVQSTGVNLGKSLGLARHLSYGRGKRGLTSFWSCWSNPASMAASAACAPIKPTMSMRSRTPNALAAAHVGLGPDVVVAEQLTSEGDQCRVLLIETIQPAGFRITSITSGSKPAPSGQRGSRSSRTASRALWPSRGSQASPAITDPRLERREPSP